jgi:tetratricopeptide (TPR) repeat protein
MPKLKKTLLILIGMTAATMAQAQTSAQLTPKITEANAEFVYKYLLGEIAGQRGELLLASQLFLDLAQQTRDARLAERSAKAAAFANQPAIALRASTLWSELDPDSVEAQKAASQLLIASGDLDKAKPQLQKLLANETNRANGFLYLNTLLSRQFDKKRVLSLVQELAKPYPKLAEAHFAIAQAAYISENSELATQELAIADKFKPGWEVSAQMQGQMLFKESPDKSLAFYNAFLKKYPNANEVRMAYAKTLVNQKRFKEAKPEFTKLIDNSKNDPDTIAIVGLLSLESNEYSLADSYLEKSLKSGFKDPDQIHLYLGRSAEKQNNLTRAMAWYDKITDGKFYLDGRISAANILAKTKNVDFAIKMLDSIDDLSPDEQILVIQNESNLLQQANRNQEAFDLLKNASDSFPTSVGLLYDHAMVAEKLGQFDLMEDKLNKVIKLQPDSAAAYNALGYSMADRNVKLTEAKNLIETAVKLAPNDHYILDSLGWVYYRLNDLPNAVKYLKQAYQFQQDPEIAAHLGEVLWKLGQQEEAKKIWDQGLKSYPNNEVLVATTQRFKS